MKQIDGKSMDIVKENIEKLKNIFPDVFREDKIDFDHLKTMLGEYIEEQQERYSFTWNGKSKAIRLAQTPSTGTLRPCKEESKNWDTTQNLYIEGDNLEVLKLLQKTYHNKIKMIYIDPPYNTGNDFVYLDNYKEPFRNYLELTGQINDEGNKLATNSESSGRYHTNWLNMIYPRLRLARNLLADDGVVFISIDENENYNLRKICNEIFGEENYLQEIVWQKKFSPQNDAKYFSLNHENVLCYAKNKNISNIKLLPMTEEQKERYKNIDNDPRGSWMSSDISVARRTEKDIYPIKTPSGKEIYPSSGRSWSMGREKIEQLIKENRIWFGVNGDNVPRLKRFLHETNLGMVPISIWLYDEVGHTQSASQELKSLFDGKKYFDFPKPIDLIKKMLIVTLDKNDIVLDFFSGSATTANSIMKFNVENDARCRYIMVQLPEPTDEKSEAYKDGYKNICEIGRERIRRAGEKILAENAGKEGIEKLDIGFKVFKLDSSNIKIWNPDYDNIELTLEDMINNFVDGRTEEDILYEIMLKYGIDLTYAVEEFNVAGSKVFSVGFGALVVCLDDNITIEIAEGIAKLIQEQSPEVARVIFKDNGFASDSVKTNVLQTLKKYGIEEVVSI